MGLTPPIPAAPPHAAWLWESDGGFKVQQLMGWSHCTRVGGGWFRCVSTQACRNPTAVLPGNPWQQLLLSHFLALGGRCSSWRLPPPLPAHQVLIIEPVQLMNFKYSGELSTFCSAVCVSAAASGNMTTTSLCQQTLSIATLTTC